MSREFFRIWRTVRIISARINQSLLYFSGWLSGKVKKGSTGPEAGSRMEWAAGRAHHSHPDWAWFSHNQQVWNILDAVEDIAKTKGMKETME